MKKKRMEYCEVISYLLPYDWIARPTNTIDAQLGYLPRKGNYTLINDPNLPAPPQEEITNDFKELIYELEDVLEQKQKKVYYERIGERERAFVFYGTVGYVKKFERDSEGNTRFFPSALDAVNYLANKGWHLDKTFKSRSMGGHEYWYCFEHWIMAREIEVDE